MIQKETQELLTLNRQMHGSPDGHHRHVVDSLTLVLAGVTVVDVDNRQSVTKTLQTMSIGQFTTNPLPRHARRRTTNNQSATDTDSQIKHPQPVNYQL